MNIKETIMHDGPLSRRPSLRQAAETVMEWYGERDEISGDLDDLLPLLDALRSALLPCGGSALPTIGIGRGTRRSRRGGRHHEHD